jgi:hypothetical protein
MKKPTSSGGPYSWFRLLALGLTSANLLSGTAFAQKYQEASLVSNTNQSGVTTVDLDLVDCRGISRSSGGARWASDKGKGVATLHDGTGVNPSLIVTIPRSGSSSTMGLPTGIVFNGSTDFDVEPRDPAVFTFAAFDGTISAWNLTANAGVDQGQGGWFRSFTPVATDLTQRNDQSDNDRLRLDVSTPNASVQEAERVRRASREWTDGTNVKNEFHLYNEFDLNRALWAQPRIVHRNPKTVNHRP